MRCGYFVDSQSIGNIMDEKYYKRGSIEKDGYRPRNSATIQDEEITIYMTSYKAKHITTTTTSNRRKDRRQMIPWPIKKYLDN